tara:strand:- start:4991 stop:6514 length:1524 start_codon:yes stop_codon:yes gene_type:complete
MAIRDFGNSLLADVRERADEQRDEARRYAKKQDKRNLLKGLGAMAGGALIKSAGTAITASLENKTKDFLANSQMSDNVVLVNSADAKIKEAIAYREEAKKLGLSINDYSLQQTAGEKATQAMLSNPNAAGGNHEDEYRAAFARHQDVIASSTLKAEYYTSILDQADQFQTGKNRQTLLDLGKQQKPASLVGSMWNKLTNKNPSSEVFNNTMSEMDQVIAATAIDKLKFKEMSTTASKLVEDGTVTPKMGKWFAGVYFNKEQLEEIKTDIANGVTRITDVTHQVVNGSLVEIKSEEVTDQQKNKKKTASSKIVIQKEDKPTLDQLVSVTGSLTKVRESMAASLDDVGYKNWSLAVSKIIQDPDNVTYEDYNKIVALSFQPKLFLTRGKDVGKFVRALSIEQMQANFEKYTVAAKPILAAIGSFPQNISTTEAEERTKLYVQLDNLQNELLNIAGTEEGLSYYPDQYGGGVVGDKFPASIIKAIIAVNPTFDEAEAQSFLENEYENGNL